MKELTLTDKGLLKKHLESQIKNFRLLILPFLLINVLAYFAFRQQWIADTFPAYLALLGLVLFITLLVSLVEIIRARKALSCTSKVIKTGRLTKKSVISDEHFTGYYFVVSGEKYEVEADQFEAFHEGDRVKLEFSVKGRILLGIKPVKQHSRLHSVYRKARLSARKFRR